MEWEKSCTLEEWLETRRADSDVNEDYESLVSLIHEKAEHIIPKKQVCTRHCKGWWNQELTLLSKAGLPLTLKSMKSRLPTLEIWKSHLIFLEVPVFSVIPSQCGRLSNLL